MKRVACLVCLASLLFVLPSALAAPTVATDAKVAATVAPAPVKAIVAVPVKAVAKIAPVVKVTKDSLVVVPAKEVAPIKVEAPVKAVIAPVVPVVKEEIGMGGVVLRSIIEGLFGLVLIMISALIRVVMKKFGFEAEASKVNDIVSKAISFAEQKSLTALKVSGAPMKSAEKMELAIKFAKSIAEDYKLPQKGSDWWENKVESWLGAGKKAA